jgi:23S rRNA (uracil1939-C5)-methyltransferase
MLRQLTIDRLGHRGDGIAETPEGRVFVPYALPGESVEAEVDGDRGRLVAVTAASPERVEPPCPLFGTCGGCALQHLAPSPYAAWKRGLVVDALRQAGIEVPVAQLVDATAGGRRRVTFHARRIDGRPAIGFMAARSHELVSVERCLVLAPALAGAPAAALNIAGAMGLAKPLDIQLTATLGGLDVDLRGHGPASDALRNRLVVLAGTLDLARLSLHGEVVVERRPPLVRMGRGDVALPPGGFLQATAAGQDALVEIVDRALEGAKVVADLFSGCGTFALPLAARATVHAVESDAAALAALDKAARHGAGLRPVSTERRDLFRRPLAGPELDRFDAVVFDPPRAGAEAQARQLAASDVPLVVGVSCDPASFARDARLLIDGGFALDAVTPVDQFAWSAHVELVGVFRRDRRRPARRRPLLR